MHHLLEDLAALTLADLGVVPPINAFHIACLLGLKIRKAPIERAVYSPDRELVVYSQEAIPQRQQGLVATHIAEHVLRESGVGGGHGWASYLGAAIQVPALALISDLAELGLDLFALRTRHPFVSQTLLARRLADVTGGEVTLWKQGKMKWARGLAVPIPKHAVQWEIGEGYALSLRLGPSSPLGSP
ncbi:MAG: hypothetical protein AAGE52_01525 [Myxococcota bacterium]